MERLDANGRAVPGSFTTNLQVDRTAIDGGVTGGGVNATWTTAATRGTLVLVEYGKENT